jgi:serine/threonine-protein kinase
VIKLAAGTRDQTLLPFTGLSNPKDVTVDGTGAVYVADNGNKRVVKLAAGSGNQTVLPFTGLSYLRGITVDRAGTVYVVDHSRVVKLVQH